MKNLLIGPLLSIIIVSYNCRDFVVTALQSVQQFVDASCEVIVVDNASSDDTTSVIPASFPHVTFIANTDNAGFSEANNQGVAVAKGRYVMLLNPDAKLINGDWKKAVAYLEQHPGTILGPRILNPDGSLQGSAFSVPTFASIFKEAFFLSYIHHRTMEEILKRDDFALSGACLLLRRELYQQLDGLDKHLFWMDDVDFCYRARKAGISIVYYDDWQIMHVIGQSSKKNYNVSISNQLISKLKFFRKHGRYVDFLLSLPFMEFQVITRLLVFLMTSPFSRTSGQKFKAYWYTQILLITFIFTGKKRTF